MKKAFKISTYIAVAFALLITPVLQISTSTSVAEAAISDWQKGVSIYSRYPDDFSSDSFKETLRDAKDAGISHVSLVVPVYQHSDSSSDIFPGADTPTDASLISAIQYAHSLGLKVMLKPHLGSFNGSNWRATISASDRDNWFRNYGTMLNRLGDIGKQEGVEAICIGTELISMATFTSNPDNTQRWNTMIADLRTHFSGKLTYSSNWGGSDFAEEVPHIGFWPALDFIGISGYYPLAQGSGDPSMDQLVGSLSYWNEQKVKPISTQYGKPVIFTEIGYRSIQGAHETPWDGGIQRPYDGEAQRELYEAMFQFWNSQPHIVGAYIWNWDSRPEYGGSGNTDYTPQHKPAEDVMRNWFGSNTNPDPDPATTTPPGGGTGSQTSGDWTASATAPAMSVHEAGTISVTVRNSGQSTGMIVDIEVYDSSGNQVFQKFYENQSVSSAAPGQYSVSWTPESEGQYVLKTGIFNHDWTVNHSWHDEVLKISIGEDGSGDPDDPDDPDDPGEPTGNLTTNVWWPTDGASVQGIQPFKAMIEGKDVSEYKMYWRVDGGGLVEMADSSVDYPHKEALVDLGPWSWKGDGPYNVEFVSKDAAGNTISTKMVSIVVVH